MRFLFLKLEIIEKTNFILDCERKLELIDVKLRFISPPSREVQATCSKEENLLNFFKLVHVKGSLSKSMFDHLFAYGFIIMSPIIIRTSL